MKVLLDIKDPKSQVCNGTFRKFFFRKSKTAYTI